MGHAAHFLRRLDRLSDPHVELALTLYNDPDLLGATLKRAKLPDGAERLAIALDHPVEGPFLVVTREGRFVTCLGRGMRTGDLPIVTREQLDAAASSVERMREAIAQARFFDSNQGLLRKQVNALYSSAEWASREQIEDLVRWEPLLGTAFLHACWGTAIDLIDARGLVKNITRPHARHEKVLRGYHESLHALAHLYVLSAASPQARELLAKLVDADPNMTFGWAAIRNDVGYLIYRGLWAVGRIGKPLLPSQKRRLRGSLTFLGLADAVLPTAMLGLANEKLRTEVRKALASPRTFAVEEDPRNQPMSELFDAVVSMLFEQAESADQAVVAIGREILFRVIQPLRSKLGWEREEDVPEDLARIIHLQLPRALLHDVRQLQTGLLVLPWLARAEPGELYFPQEVIDVIRHPWSMDQTIRLLEAQRSEEGVRQPLKSEKTGRNAPCTCGSGKKYKRCCGA